MTLLEKIKLTWRNKTKGPFSQTKHIIKYAFTSGGVDYYEFDTTANLPWKRGLKFLSIYNEMDMRCDRFYLQKHTEAMENILTGGKKIGLDELIKIRQLNSQMKERLEWIYQEDLVYKIASVVFFDAQENPDDWEWKYALEKIERWKKDGDAGSFFLHEPIRRLIPFLSDSRANFQTYSEAQREIDKAQLENIYAMLSEKANASSVNFTERYFSAEMNQSSPS
jgi:hypothetical protein